MSDKTFGFMASRGLNYLPLLVMLLASPLSASPQESVLSELDMSAELDDATSRALQQSSEPGGLYTRAQEESESGKVVVDPFVNEKTTINPYTGSQVPDRSEALLSLQRFVEMAVLHSPEIRDAKAVWIAAFKDLQAAKGARWPRVDISGTSRSKEYGQGNPLGNGITGRATLTATLNLYDGGKIGHQLGNRDFMVRAENARYDQVRNKIASDTVVAYLQLARYELQMSAYQAHLQRMRTLAGKLKEIVATLPGRRSELTQANARVLQAQENLMSAVMKRREFQIQLGKLIGAKLKPREISRFELVIPVPDLEHAMSYAVQHPSIRAARAEAAAAKESMHETKAGLVPTVDLQASKMSGQDQWGYDDPGRVFIAFNWNLFQGFSTVALTGSSVARAASAEEKYHQVSNEVEFRLMNIWAAYRSQNGRLDALQSLKEEAWQVREDYFSQWRDLGRRSLLELLASETEYLNAELALINTRIDANLSAAGMYAEAGILDKWLIGSLIYPTQMEW